MAGDYCSLAQPAQLSYVGATRSQDEHLPTYVDVGDIASILRSLHHISNVPTD